MDAAEIKSILDALRANNPTPESIRFTEAIERLALQIESLERTTQSADRLARGGPVRRNFQHHIPE